MQLFRARTYGTVSKHVGTPILLPRSYKYDCAVLCAAKPRFAMEMT